jgi:DNA-binding transcriptional ArsR family regulator
MIEYRFGPEDVARTRFAISPLWETAAAIRALRNPSVASLHLPWVKRIRPHLKGMDLSLPLALLPRKGYIADFLTPPPVSPLMSFEDEIELVRATSPEQVRNDVEILVRNENPPETLQPYLDDPEGAVQRLADALEEFWAAALESDWPRIQSLLEADILYRSRRLAEGGVDLLFSDLHGEVRWGGDVLTVHCTCAVPALELAGRGLVLVPSAFYPHKTAAMTEEPWQPTLIYPARGGALLWEEAAAAPEALAKVVGKSRAALLADLSAPRTTTDLAQRLEMTPGGVSQHLSVLKESGFVTARRNGRAVLYCRSELADQLVTTG